MSLRSKKISFRKTRNKNRINNINQDINALDKIVFIDVKSHLDKNGNSAECEKNYEQRFFRLVSRVLRFKQIFGRILNRGANQKSQKEAFDSAMKYLLLLGQILGILPILNKEIYIPQAKWSIFSWRYIYFVYVNTIVLFVCITCFFHLSPDVTVTKLVYFTYYTINFASSFSFMFVSRKWNYLMKQLENADLNEYIDPLLKYKCNLVVIIMACLSLVEHILAIAVRWTAVEHCMPNEPNVFQSVIIGTFFWLFDLNATYSTGLAIFLLIQNFFIAMIWNYLHIFIICTSLFLTSILEQINKVILSREGQYLPPSCWRKLREDYNRATRLVRCFDDVINATMLISFAGNLLVVCAQLYYFFSIGYRVLNCPNTVTDDTNNPSMQFHSYIMLAFGLYALFFMVLRSIWVALAAARVHSASILAAPALYSVPAPTFCTEVQRFIEQIHGTTVGLTGLNFFYVTKEIILSVVGTIVTYELVLLQFVKTDRII